MNIEELKVEMYVRTKDGSIVKPKILEEWTSDLLITDDSEDFDFEETLYLPDVVKYSFNLIDLIEENDVLKVGSEDRPLVREVFIKDGERYIYYYDEHLPITEIAFDGKNGINFLGVVTKEQFNSCKYEVQ